MKSKNAQIVFGIGSFILGGVIGSVVEKLINYGLNAAYLGILVLAMALFTTTSMVLFALAKQDFQGEQVLSSLAGLERRLGLRVLYQELGEIGKEAREDHLAKLMREAKFEILELGRSEIHEQQTNPDLPPSDLRQDYYDSILGRVRNQAAKGITFVYKRIIQFPTATGSFSSLGDMIYVDHCRHMVGLAEVKGVRSYVKRTLITSPICFLIIDREYLVICVDSIRHSGDNEEQYLKGEIIIHDPQQELVQIFLREWDVIENSPHTQTVTLADF